MTTLCLPARFLPSYSEKFADPRSYPPPWNQIITGRFSPRFSSGVHTFKLRQSSLIGPFHSITSTSGTRPPPSPRRCGHLGPNSPVSRTPVHGSGLTGGINRRRPAVDAPKGTPLNVYTFLEPTFWT